jgi:hypothetical protein
MHNTLGTPERLMTLAAMGRLTKQTLAGLLVEPPRQEFLHACAAIEKKYTDECAAGKDTCLDAGCSMDGEVCLQPLLRAGAEFHKACGGAWVKLFANQANRA